MNRGDQLPRNPPAHSVRGTLHLTVVFKVNIQQNELWFLTKVDICPRVGSRIKVLLEKFLSYFNYKPFEPDTFPLWKAALCSISPLRLPDKLEMTDATER